MMERKPAVQASRSPAGRFRLWLNNRWWCGLFLCAASFLAYLPSLRGGFVWDDDSWTTGISALLHDTSGLSAMWLRPTALQQYIPLTGTTFWLDYHLWGFWTLPYHVENVLLHTLAALLFWRLLQRLDVPGAWLAAAVFALHPIMVESVAWITERKNVLSLVFFLAALLAYLRYAPWVMGDLGRARPTNSSTSRLTSQRSFFYGLAFGLFICALLAKPTTFSMPAVILLLCWWKRGEIRWQMDVLPTLPFFVMAFGLCLATAWLEKNHLGAQGRGFNMLFSERCLVAGRAPWFYAAKLFWPDNLCFLYPRWHPDVRLWWQWLYPATAAGTLLALWLARKRIGRGPATAVFIFVGSLFPLLGFVNAYAMRYSFVWDHWVYLPSLGLIALAAALVALAAEQLRTPAMTYAFAAVILPALAILTWQQSGKYSNIETLWRTTIARNPDAFLAYNNLGYIYLQRGEVDQAIPYLKNALEINSNFFEAHNNLGNALMRKGRLGEAMEHLKKAIEIAPDSAESHYNLGNALLQDGRLDEAMEQFNRVLEMEPDYAKACNNLAVALMRSGRLDEAVAKYRKALQINPAYAEAYYNLGCLFDRQDRLDDAVEQYQKAIRFKPDYVEAHYHLAMVLGVRGRLDEAITEFQQAIQLKPDHADAHGNLANALVAQGRLDEALKEYRLTLTLVPGSAQAHFRFGEALQQQKNITAAIEQYRETLRLDANHEGAKQQLRALGANNP